jgi:hypothetical protein
MSSTVTGAVLSWSGAEVVLHNWMNLPDHRRQFLPLLAQNNQISSKLEELREFPTT